MHVHAALSADSTFFLCEHQHDVNNARVLTFELVTKTKSNVRVKSQELTKSVNKRLCLLQVFSLFTRLVCDYCPVCGAPAECTHKDSETSDVRLVCADCGAESAWVRLVAVVRPCAMWTRTLSPDGHATRVHTTVHRPKTDTHMSSTSHERSHEHDAVQAAIWNLQPAPHLLCAYGVTPYTRAHSQHTRIQTTLLCTCRHDTRHLLSRVGCRPRGCNSLSRLALTWDA